MRYARLLDNAGGPRWARVTNDDAVFLLDEAPWHLSDPDAAGQDPVGAGFEGRTFLAPGSPSKIVLASSNYHEVLELLGKAPPAEPLLFLKPPTAVLGPETSLMLPPESNRVTGEPELAVVIGQTCTRASLDTAMSYVFGYTCLNDVSARDIQEREVQFTRAKGYDTFCPIGPWIQTEWPGDGAAIYGSIDGVEQIRSTLTSMVFSVPELVSFTSHCMTLLPGDVISTGASGIVEISGASSVTISIDGVGHLTNTVRAVA